MQTVALREIRSASRRPFTYWARPAAAGIAAAVIFSTIMYADFGIIGGRNVFLTAVGMAFALCLLESVRQASTSIVEERVEGTLGLLLLTRIRGSELLLGKFSALAFFSMQTLLAITPMLAMSLLLGGVSGAEMARAALGLITTLIATLTVGLVISARSREPSKAMIGTFFLLLIGAIILSLGAWPVIGWAGFLFQSLNPMTPIWKIPDLAYSQFKIEYWNSVAFIVVASTLALWLTSRKLTSTFSLEALKKSKPPLLPPVIQKASPPSITVSVNSPAEHIPPSPALEISNESVGSKATWFEGNPIEWLTLRHLGLHGKTYLPITFALVLGMLSLLIHFWAILLYLLVFIIFGFLFSAGATMTLARARQSGELELWLTTPLGVQNIIKGNLAVLRRVFLWPGIVLLISYLAMLYVSVFPAFSAVSLKAAPPNQNWTFIYLFALMLSAIAGLLFALPHVGMWIALKAKTPAQAAVRTFLLMVICPWFVIFVPKIIIFIPLGIVASHSVKRGLKEFAIRRAG